MTSPIHSTEMSQADINIPEKNLLGILGNLESLTGLYREEIDALELYDMQKLYALQPDKVKLVEDCEIRMNEVSSHADQYKMVSSALKERVMTAQKALNDLAEKSKRTCAIRAESAARVQNRLIAVARTMIDENQKNYNEKGERKATSKTRPVATAINEAI